MGIRELQHEETEARQWDRGSWRLDIRGAEGLMLSEKTLMKSGEWRPPLGPLGFPTACATFTAGSSISISPLHKTIPKTA